MAEGKRKSRRGLWIALAAFLFLVSLPLVAWLLLRTPPSYWKPPDPASPQVVRSAQEVEGFVTSQTTAVRPQSDTWAIELKEEQVNAWLAARLPQWLENQQVDAPIKEMFPRVMVRFAPGGVELAAQVLSEGRPQVVSVAFEPLTPGEGKPVKIKLAAVYVGRLRLPAEQVLNLVASSLGEKGDALGPIREGIELRLPLADNREVHVVGVEMHKGRLVLVCVTR